MKRILLISALVLSGSMIFAQAQNTQGTTAPAFGRGMGGKGMAMEGRGMGQAGFADLQNAKQVIVEGKLAFVSGEPVLVVAGKSIPLMIPHFYEWAYTNSVKDGASLKVDAKELVLPSRTVANTTETVYCAVKVTVGGKDYDFSDEIAFRDGVRHGMMGNNGGMGKGRR